jgi:hypothetical protein
VALRLTIGSALPLGGRIGIVSRATGFDLLTTSLNRPL